MTIASAIRDGDSSKQRGDLLEDLAKKMLEIQNYEVETQIRNTGMELDLLCKNRANHSKRIYVECKAYGVNSKIQADVIKNIVGIKDIENLKKGKTAKRAVKVSISRAFMASKGRLELPTPGLSRRQVLLR